MTVAGATALALLTGAVVVACADGTAPATKADVGGETHAYDGPVQCGPNPAGNYAMVVAPRILTLP